jgi:hypothetical protein
MVKLALLWRKYNCNLSYQWLRASLFAGQSLLRQSDDWPVFYCSLPIDNDAPSLLQYKAASE